MNRAKSTINRASARVIFVRRPQRGFVDSLLVVVFNHRGTLTLSTTGLSPMDTPRTRAPAISVPSQLDRRHFQTLLRSPPQDGPPRPELEWRQESKSFHFKREEQSSHDPCRESWHWGYRLGNCKRLLL